MNQEPIAFIMNNYTDFPFDYMDKVTTVDEADIWSSQDQAMREDLWEKEIEEGYARAQLASLYQAFKAPIKELLDEPY